MVKLEEQKKYRIFGFDLIINTFEPFLREFIKNKILLYYFQDDWMQHIPSKIIRFIDEYRNLKFNEIRFSIATDDLYL